MGCVTTCSPPYDVMVPAGFGQVTLAEDIMCGTSNALLWLLGIGMGYLVAEKAISYFGK